jgi:hypothetical protein
MAVATAAASAVRGHKRKLSEAEAAAQGSNPKPDACDEFLPRKRRFCNLRKLEGMQYCSQHAPAVGEAALYRL